VYSGSVLAVCLQSTEVAMPENVSDQGMPPDVVLQSTLLNFKKEILTLVLETIELKLNKIPALITEELPKANNKKANETSLKQQRSYANATEEGKEDGLLASKVTEATDPESSNVPPAKRSSEKHVLLLKPKESTDVTT